MANNIILAVPSANSSVNYELPQSESAKLSFAPEDINGLQLDASGGLVISFVEGGQVTLNNFQGFIDNGNTLTLADGTQVDPKLLFNALGGEATAPLNAADDAIKIEIPAANAQNEITLEPGQKYLMNFDLTETAGANVKDGKMVIDFANGGKITIANYETAMASATPPELSLAAKTCIVTGDELITNIQQLAKSGVVEETIVAEEVIEEEKPKSKIAAADMEGKEDIGPGDETDQSYQAAQVEPAAGEAQLAEADIARQLAEIETAAGGAGGAGRAGGYGYGSRFAPDPFAGKPDIGPIDPTALNYRAPVLEPSRFIDVDQDSSPIAIQPGAQFVDETNLENGPLVVGGSLSIDYGADGPGGVSSNGEFGSGGSQTNNVLTSNGQPVTVTVVGNDYVATTPDGTVVFKLEVNPANGDYIYTQFGTLDHADGTNPNDQITLNFGVTARDGDGDAVSTTIQIVVADDAPEITGDENTIDETDLGPIVINDKLENDFNSDGPGRIETTGSFASSGSQLNGALTSSGVQVIVSSTPTGYVGTAGGVTVFTLTINAATGEYTYTQFKNLDHADASNPNDIITLTFGAKIIDYDGDTATAPIVINIKDDAPIFQPPEDPENPPEHPPEIPGNPKPDKGLEIVDETNLKGGPAVETGKLDADFGSDVPGSYAFKDGSFASSGSKTAGQLTHNGIPVVVTLANGEWIGKAGDLTVFKLELNTATGDYKFTLYDNLDHADKTNPDDQIVLDFGVAAADFDGDRADGSIRIIVKDDGPVANDDVNTYDTTFGVANGNVVTGLNGGPGAADVISTDGWTATDNSNKVVKIAFAGNEIDVPETGTVSIDGEYGTLTIQSDGTYTYKAFDNGGMVTPGAEKEFVSGPALPDFDESQALDGVEQQSIGIAPGNLSLDGGETVTVTFQSEQAGYGNTMGVFTVGPDGKLKAETVLIKDGNAASQGQSFTYAAGADSKSLGFFIVADGASINNGYQGIDFSKGSLNFVFDYGTGGAREATISDDGSKVKLVYTSETGVETVINGPLYFTSDRGSSDNLNADGTVRVVSGVPGDDNTVLRIGFEDLPGLGDKDFNDIVFDVSIKGKDCGCGDPEIKDQFVYTLQDGDGDKDKATLTLGGKDLTDDVPSIVHPAEKTVDETNLKDGALHESGKIVVDFGHDGPGTVAANGSFNSSGSQTNNALSHKGIPVHVSLVGDTYVGTAGNITVFTMQIKTDGTYSFKQFEQLDHADGHNPNDIISLEFGAKATDCDGDKSYTKIVINVKDDAPVAHNDSNHVGEGQTVTGNVLTNDTVGQDVPGLITKITIGGKDYTVPANGSVTIPGQYGTLVIDKTGQYSYTASNNNPNGKDEFSYTLKDSDGDKATACLTIDVTCVDDVPTITCAVETIDETYLKDGVITETGAVTAGYGNDGPGSVTANGSFTAGGSKLAGQLTSHGVPITVSLNSATNTYEGKAGGTTVFTLVVAANGSYSFKLFEQLDHADGNNPNDIIDLNFGVVATDADGDKATATITINVKDDAPIANDDARQVATGQTSINGNVTHNDVVGQDVDGAVTQISFGGTVKSIPGTGTVSIDGQYGKLTIDHTGAYTYVAKAGAHGVDNFNYVLKDNDGDKDDACLSIEVKENPITVCINAEDACVKEDSHVNVPVSASYQQGSGNETMTITLTGVPSGWTVTSPGWTVTGGVYTLVLAQGVRDFNGSLNFKPPANSDVDLNGLVFKASVYDPDTNSTKTATDGANIIVDAVIDPFKFNASLNDHPSAAGSGKIFVLTNEWNTHNAKLNISNLTHNDADGSESLKKIIFTISDRMDDTTYISVKNSDGSFTKVGTKGSAGSDTTYTIDVSGMTYEQAKDYVTNKLYLTNTGHSGLNGNYNLGIQIVKYEKNLSGIEKDYSDNETSYTVCLPVEFCISPLVIDLDKDGVELLSVEQGVLFDITNDGVKDKTGWAAKDDALLALDKNHDGSINDRSELFGNSEDHANGFASLAAYDLNGDGIIDANDAVFNDLKVWQDSNSDGISQAHELKSLSDINIAAIKLGAQDVSYEIAGNPVTHESTVVYGDGSSSAIVDAWFAYNDGTATGVDKGLSLRGTEGNDVLSGGTGNDDLYGGAGADTFLFQTISEGVDTLKDFNAAEGDKIDLSNVLSNFDPLTDAINDFVFATATDDGKTILSVNAEGTGSAAAHQFAVMDSGNVNVADLFNNGSIVV